MGTEEFSKFINEGSAMKACDGVLIIATPESLAEMSQAVIPGIELYPCANDAALPAALVDAAKVVVVEIDPDLPRSMARLTELGRTHPALPKIAAIANSSIPMVRMLVREGVSDVVSLPFKVEDLVEVALAAVQTANAAARSKVVLAPLVAVMQSTGGCGATSVATHLASSLANFVTEGHEIAIADFDLQSGAVAEYLGSRGSGSMSDLLASGDRLDPDLIRSISRATEQNLVVFAAPPLIEPIESVETEQVLQVLTMMRQLYAGVVIDLPSDVTNWSLSALSAADLIVIVVELSVSSLRQARRRLDLFESIGIERSRIAVVVNRVEKRMFKAIDLSDVDETLGREVLGSLPLDEKELRSAQTQGVLVHDLNRRNKFNVDVIKLAGLIEARLPFRKY